MNGVELETWNSASPSLEAKQFILGKGNGDDGSVCFGRMETRDDGKDGGGGPTPNLSRERR